MNPLNPVRGSFSEEALKDLHAALSQRQTEGARSYYRVPDTPALKPDVWFEPCQVC